MRTLKKVNPNMFSLTKTAVVDRSLRIVKGLIGKRISIYNGKEFVSLLIRDYHVGYRFGQFIKTKKLGGNIHNKELKKQKK
jgi:ribosomal protein S19